MSIKLPAINASRADTTEKLLKSFQTSAEDFWKTIPTKIDPDEEREYLEEEVVAYLRTLLHRYNANQDWDRYNKVADIIDNIQNHNVTPDYLLKQILNAKEREEMQNSEIYKAYRLQQAQKQMGCIKRLNNGYANTKSNLTKNPNSTTKPFKNTNITVPYPWEVI